ncbi:MAG: efflux RND transporter periplasmic adaptor subunit [Thermoanaerobaculia bacterium]
MAKRALWVAGLLGAALLARWTVLRPSLVPVTVFRTASGRVEETVTNSKAGTVKSRRRATLSAEVGGRVRELPARKGARVRRGDILLKIADNDTRALVLVQESAVTAAKAARVEACRAAEQLDRDLARNRQLAKDKIVSSEILDQLQSRRDSAAAACEGAVARIAQAEAAREVARVTLEKTVLRAPFDGVVADVTTEVGEWITPSPPGLPIPPVIVLIEDAAMYVSAPMDEVDVAKVRIGQPARITIDAYPGRPFPGKVTRVAPYVLDVQEQNRTFEIEAELEDVAFARKLPHGTSADVEVILAARDGVLRIPSYALLEGGRVLVVEKDRLAARKVKTGLKNWQFVEVAEGLAAGDLVTVSLDRAEVKEGARVRIEAETKK